jgi:hypothetical protein
MINNISWGISRPAGNELIMPLILQNTPHTLAAFAYRFKRLFQIDTVPT